MQLEIIKTTNPRFIFIYSFKKSYSIFIYTAYIFLLMQCKISQKSGFKLTILFFLKRFFYSEFRDNRLGDYKSGF